MYVSILNLIGATSTGKAGRMKIVRFKIITDDIYYDDVPDDLDGEELEEFLLNEFRKFMKNQSYTLPLEARIIAMKKNE